MPFSLLYAINFGEGLLGCNSTWLTAGTILQEGSLSNFSRFLIPKFDTPMFLTLPVAGSFCISSLHRVCQHKKPLPCKISLPCLDKVPVREVLRQVVRIC